MLMDIIREGLCCFTEPAACAHPRKMPCRGTKGMDSPGMQDGVGGGAHVSHRAH